MKVAILGSNGMLGGMLSWFFEQNGVDYEAFGRDKFTVCLGSDTWLDLSDVLLSEDGQHKFDYIINCIGAIKPGFERPETVSTNIFVNAVFPRELAEFVNATNAGSALQARVIHITTDCVFSGKTGKYTEDSTHDATDMYGMSKSLGESKECMVIRTSIIGPEWNGNKKSLVEWFMSNYGNTLNGFTNHLWNGVTTLELSKLLLRIMNEGLWEKGTFHVFSEDIVKADMLKLFAQSWGLTVDVKLVEAPTACDRTLRTVKKLNSKLAPASQYKMMSDLAPFITERPLV